MTTTALARINDSGIEIKDTNDLTTAVQMIVTSNLCPKQYMGKPKDAMIAILAGRQVGWGPIQALQYIAVINGRPSMYGDGPTGLAHGSGKVAWINEWWECKGQKVDEPNFASLRDYPDSLTACWQAKRKDNTGPTKTSRFSVADAKTAGLWGKTGPWTQYPKRMLTCRARAWGLRDNFSDALQGISQAEEWADMQPKRGPDPLEAPVVEGSVVEQGEPVEPQEPPALTAEDKLQLIGDVQKYIAEKAPAEPLDAKTLIIAVANVELGKPTIDTISELEKVREAITSGQYDLETGAKIPPATE